ncbi:hypothetical protein Hypma_012618 [Hypsizygus marmoreus]|uniref:Uncharacterized protein n=1 Tax=Hypsizygus marmoreus TaxID=39966 RepID=A0A369JLP1_HYPMA|nr:hypothetical protein Hypma_012618 [Hypsizygus marmoreus]
MYFTRVAKIFEDAEVSRPQSRMIESGGGGSAFLFSSASEPVTVGTVESSAAPPGTLYTTMGAGIGLTAQVGVANFSSSDAAALSG